jgi:hypothetical protein
MEELHYYFSWIIFFQNREKSEVPPLDTKPFGSKLLPIRAVGEKILEEIPRTTIYSKI